jgi:pimeloyl-ACP methyl ester carboxylesterase
MSDAVYRTAAAAVAVAQQYRKVLDQWPVPKTELRLDTRQGETFVVVCGPDSAPPVLLLHGSQANSAAGMIDAALWSQKFRVYAVDMIGEPGFSARVRPPLDSDAHALWMDDVLGGLGLSKAAFVGTSLGGWLALDYASRRPSAVERLALICPAGIGRQKNFLLKALPLLLLGTWGKQRMRRMVFGPSPAPSSPTAQSLQELMELISRTVRPRVVSIPRLSDEQLRRVEAPVLVAIGGRDVLLDSFDTRQRLARLVPHADVRFYETGYHYLPAQAPIIFEFLLREFPAGSQHGQGS